MARPAVVIAGAGFGGLACARSLRGEPVDVLLVDRNNYHLFTPLLYQVATSLLNPSDVAQPARTILRGAPNVRVHRAEITGLELDDRRIRLADGTSRPWDYLVLAVGSETRFFGDGALREACLGLKDLPQAMELRNHTLACFEEAVLERTDPERRRELLTFVIAGGGPTGVEYAGALSELIRLEQRRDFPELDLSQVRIVLVEGADRVLPEFSPELGEDAARRLSDGFGVEVRRGTKLSGLDGGVVVLSDGERIRTASLVWAAGVRPSALVGRLGLPLSDTGRVSVDRSLRVRGHPGVFCVGDMAGARGDDGELPMLSAPAMQEGRHVAGEILRAIRGAAPSDFEYRDKGIMATIGRNAAVAQIGPLRLTGWPGWMAWLLVHLWYIIGFRRRLWVLAGWAWNYLFWDRPIRNIVAADRSEGRDAVV